MLNVVTQADVQRQIRANLPGILRECSVVVVGKIVLANVCYWIVDLCKCDVMFSGQAVTQIESKRVSNPTAKSFLNGGGQAASANRSRKRKAAVIVVPITLTYINQDLVDKIEICTN